MEDKLHFNKEQTEELLGIISLNERMDEHLTNREAIENSRQIILENTFYDPTDYNYVPTSEFGLPVDTLIDDGRFYKHQPCGLIMFFRNGYTNENEWIPLSISSDPQILSRIPIKIYRSDLYKIRLFVFKNQKRLQLLADGQIGYVEFKAGLKSLNEIKETLDEMAILWPKDTGAPLRIWVDNGSTWKTAGHGPRLKIENPKGEDDSRSYIPISLPNTELMVSDNEIKVSKGDFRKTMNFIKQNKEFLYQITINGGTTSDIINGIVKVNKKGEPLPQLKEPDYVKIKDLMMGYSLVKNNEDKWNILTPGANLLTKEWFDSIGEMTEEKGFLVAPILRNKEHFMLFIDVKENKKYIQKVKFNVNKS